MGVPFHQLIGAAQVYDVFEAGIDTPIKDLYKAYCQDDRQA